MIPDVYVICPVRDLLATERDLIDLHVRNVESSGKVVHLPYRDVDQSPEMNGAVRICDAHREAMSLCSEVHVFWQPESFGSHFDLGMAHMLSKCRISHGAPPLKFVLINNVPLTIHKSFNNVLRSMTNG